MSLFCGLSATPSDTTTQEWIMQERKKLCHPLWLQLFTLILMDRPFNQNQCPNKHPGGQPKLVFRMMLSIRKGEEGQKDLFLKIKTKTNKQNQNQNYNLITFWYNTLVGSQDLTSESLNLFNWGLTQWEVNINHFDLMDPLILRKKMLKYLRILVLLLGRLAYYLWVQLFNTYTTNA